MRWMTAFLMAGLVTTPLLAQSPVPINTIAPLSEIELLVARHFKTLEKSLEEAARFDAAKNKSIRTDFGMLSLLGQAIAEHPDNADSKINGPALRDAALAYQRKGTHTEAQAALAKIQSVLAGEVTGEHVRLHPWNKLINMHPMMEEVNSSSSDILKVLKRTRGKPEEVLPATSWALLAVAMKADTHEVKNPADLPKWNAWSDEFLESSLKLADLIRNKKGEGGREWFDKAHETCNACHEVFRD